MALVEAERRYYQEIVAAMPVGLAVLDAKLGFLSANRCFRQIFRVSEADLGSTHLKHLFPGGEIAEAGREVLDTGNPRHNLAVQYVSDEGPKPLRVSIQRSRGWDDEAEPEILLVVYDRETPSGPPPENAEAARSGLLENLDAVVWERDPETLAFTYVGGRAEAILGFPADEWTAGPGFYAERIHPEDRDWVLAYLRAAVSSTESRSCEYRARTSQGRVVWLRDVIRVVRDATGAPSKLSGITVSIDRQMQRHEQWALAEKMTALGRLASRVTHDCNNLLTILTGYGEHLLDGLPAAHPGRDDVAEILRASERLSKLTQELLRFAGRPSLSPRVFSLNSLLESYAPGIRRVLGAAIELELRLAPDLGMVNADWEQFGDALLTLAHEARQAMPEGGRWTVETAAIELPDAGPQSGETLRPGRYAALVLSDTGPALDEETRRRLFEPFFSSLRSGQDLPAVYRLLRNSGGGIQVTSGPEGGTSFTLYVPLAAVESAASPSSAEAAARPVVQTMPQATILLAEDESGIRSLIRKVLVKHGYAVLEAADGDEALRLARERGGSIHLLLSDIVMPGMTGGELATELRRIRPGIKVLFLSGCADEDLEAFGPLPRDAGILRKPFALASLLERIRAILSS